MRTVPVWVWVASAAALLTVIGAEITLTSRPGREVMPSGDPRAGTTRRAAGWVGVYVALAVACGLAIAVTAGWVTAGQFFTGYLTEYSLSLDNLAVFAVIMAAFAVPPARQPRVLLLGIGLALAMRSAVIVAGAAALNRFGWLFYPLGGILIWTAIGLVSSSSARPAARPGSMPGWPRGCGSACRGPRRAVTPVVLAVVAIGLADVRSPSTRSRRSSASPPAPPWSLACNVFALMGLRQLYVLVAGLLGRIVYLTAGLAVICAFVGVKLLLQALRGSGVSWAAEIPSWLSVLVIAAVLLATVLAGTVAGRRRWPGAARSVLARRFAAIDANGNGVLDAGDYQLAARRLCEAFGYAADSAPARAVATALGALFDRMLAHMDADGDRVITRDEFVTAAGREIGDRAGFDAAAGATARTLIQVADTDGNGVLDAGEYTRLAAVYGVDPDQAARAFGRLDLDRNGVLDTAELSRAISQFVAPEGPGSRGTAAFGHR